MSKFNQDWLCAACKEDERHTPGYAAAEAAEVHAVKTGLRNIPGVGLSAEDVTFLAQRRAARAPQAPGIALSKPNPGIPGGEPILGGIKGDATPGTSFH